MPDLFGYFDLISDDLVHGWLCDRRDTSRPVRIDAVLNTELILTLCANDRREGLLQSNIGTGCYGFRFDRALLGVKVKTVSDLNLFVGGTDILLTVGEGGAIVGKRLFAGGNFLGQPPDDTDIVATIEHEAAMIGDTLTALPFIHHLHALFGQPIHIAGEFSRPVRDLVRDAVVTFAAPERMKSVHFRLNIIAAREVATPLGLHACQGFFLLAGMALPRLPVRLDLHAEPCGLPPGVVIAPFTTTERDDPGSLLRAWHVDRWRQVVHYLTAERGIRNVYVIGSSKDDFSRFDFPGVTPMVDRPLPEVLDLMRRALLCITLDTGPSHLAHFGGVSRHLLLYPSFHRPNLVRNPAGISIYKPIVDISIDEVINSIEMLLE